MPAVYKPHDIMTYWTHHVSEPLDATRANVLTYSAGLHYCPQWLNILLFILTHSPFTIPRLTFDPALYMFTSKSANPLDPLTRYFGYTDQLTTPPSVRLVDSAGLCIARDPRGLPAGR